MEGTTGIRKVRGQAQQAAGRRGGAAQPFAKRTGWHSRNGFLNHRFLPFWVFDRDKERAEMDYFRSLSNLCLHYGLEIPDVTELSFPQNIYRSWEAVASAINGIDNKLDCIIMQDEDHTATLAVLQQMNTGNTFYYIPVRPLWRWGQVAKQEAISELLTVLFAYLYQIVEIPFYAEEGTYLKYQYDVLFDCVTEETEEQDTAEKAYREEELNTLYLLQNAGIHILRSISQPSCLERMEKVIIDYSELAEKDVDFAVLSVEFLQLYRAYPDRSIFDRIRPDLFHPEEEERIRAEEYISFYWSGNDCFIDTLDDVINTNFQEMGIIDEPIAVQLFDEAGEVRQEDFDFEKRLFSLIERLSNLLQQYDHEEHNPTI
jgi:hypothetical protein